MRHLQSKKDAHFFIGQFYIDLYDKLLYESFELNTHILLRVEVYTGTWGELKAQLWYIANRL